MSRISTPKTIDDVPEASRPALTAMQKRSGMVPNMMRLLATSPPALEGYLGLHSALSKGTLPAATRERIALAIAEVNGCAYCRSAHGFLAKRMAKLDDSEIMANRRGASSDPAADAALKFALDLVEQRGHVSDASLSAVRDAGHDDGQVLEIVMHVALNTMTNFVNEVAQTELDFPS